MTCKYDCTCNAAEIVALTGDGGRLEMGAYGAKYCSVVRNNVHMESVRLDICNIDSRYLYVPSSDVDTNTRMQYL